MSEPSPAPSRAPLVVAAVILVIPIVVPLLVGTYAKTDPTLGGMPFFFWWQFLLVPFAAILTTISYLLIRSYETKHHRDTMREHGDDERGDR